MIFLGVVGGGGDGVNIFDISKGEGIYEFRWNPTGEEGGQENTILKGTSKICGSILCKNS